MLRSAFIICSWSLRLTVPIFLLGSILDAQRVAVISPEKGALAEKFSALIRESIGSRLKVLDTSMAETAFDALAVEAPFNMTADDAGRAAAAIGCDFLLIVKAGSTRRSSFAKGDYFEAFAATYLVSGRSGLLVNWDLSSSEAETAGKAESALLGPNDSAAAEIVRKVSAAKEAEMNEKPDTTIERLPLEDPLETKNFRAPVPYKRVKPEYTPIAFLYGVRATVEIEVDIEADGRVARTAVTRWAGFGLDESVAAAVRKMNWRPAERNGKPLPMRVLLRYNFTKIEKE